MITHFDCVVVVRVDPEVGKVTIDQMITNLECVYMRGLILKLARKQSIK
jgi:hypothetical protein